MGTRCSACAYMHASAVLQTGTAAEAPCSPPPPPPLLSQYGSREAYEEAMEAAKDRSRKSEKQTVSNH
jgi:hypothetical protein